MAMGIYISQHAVVEAAVLETASACMQRATYQTITSNLASATRLGSDMQCLEALKRFQARQLEVRYELRAVHSIYPSMHTYLYMSESMMYQSDRLDGPCAVQQ